MEVRLPSSRAGDAKSRVASQILASVCQFNAMAKGSQLAQLKTALSKAGVTGQPQQGKKRKRPGSVDKDKEKRAAKLDEIHKRLNPFDTKVTKLKHDVGGRKVKGVFGKPAQSKQAGIEQARILDLLMVKAMILIWQHSARKHS